MSENKVVWHPYPKEKPFWDDEYLLTIYNGLYRDIAISNYDSDDGFDDFIDDEVLAWAELPETYKEVNE